MLSENVKRLREEHDLTQTELGEKVGVTRVFIGYIEQGFKTPKLELAKRIADVFETTIDELMS